MSESAIILVIFCAGLMLVWFFPRHKPFKSADLLDQLASAESMATKALTEQLVANERLSALEPVPKRLGPIQEDLKALQAWKAGVKIHSSDEIKAIASNTLADKVNDLEKRISALEVLARNVGERLTVLKTAVDAKVDRDADSESGAHSTAEQIRRLRAEVTQLRDHVRQGL